MPTKIDLADIPIIDHHAHALIKTNPDKGVQPWDVKGHKVVYLDRSGEQDVEPSCVLALPYNGGGLGIIIIDSSGKFGSVCDQGRKVAEVLIDRETA